MSADFDMEGEMRIKNTGLRGVTLADTKISYVNGEKGKLIYRGYNINDLARDSTFEEISYLLLKGNLPTKKEIAGFIKKLKKNRALPDSILKAMAEIDKHTPSMNVLGAVTSLLELEGSKKPQDKYSYVERSIDLISKFPTIITSWHNLRNETKIIAPRTDLTHSENFLYMLTGDGPDPELSKILDTCLILHADHTFNASTFAAREVASTRAGLYASVTAALGALSGELHGGANARVIETLNEIQSIEKARKYVSSKLDSHERVMGMGHAVYKTQDPRATILRTIAAKIGDPNLFNIAEALKKMTQEEFKKRKGRSIYPNVDFYSGIAYLKMGFPIDFFTPVFAASRVSGWCAHVMEERFAEAQPKPVLYRPKAEYIGDYCGKMECDYVKLDKR